MQIIPSAIDGEVFDYTDNAGNARRFRLNIERDSDHGAPWQENDGHGVISDWTSRDAEPWERVLNASHNSRRLYDVRASRAIALRDGWDAVPYGKGSAHEQAARAVNADFEYLRAWCNDEWWYVGVIVTPVPVDGSADGEDETPTDYAHALWGIESESTDYIKDTALELAYEASNEMQAAEAIAAREDEERAYWNARDVETV